MKQKKNNLTARPQKTSEIRKKFYKRLIFICLGIIPLLLIGEPKGPERYIGAAVVIILGYQFRLIVKQSQLIVDDYFPPKTDNETKTKPFDKFIYYFAMTLFFSGLVFEIIEIRVMDNTMNSVAFFWKSAFVGIAIATLLTIILKSTKSTVYDESSRRYAVHFGLFLGFFLLIPAVASFINHHYADKTEDCKTYKIVRKSTESSGLYLKMTDNSEERFVVSRDFYYRVFEGGQVQLCTKKGKLGYDFVEKFNPVYE